MPCIQNQLRVYRRDPEFDENRTVMQFRLTYEGPLKPSGNNMPNSTHKHDIRKAFHPQLRQLWTTNANVRSLAETPSSFFTNSAPFMEPPPPNTPSLIEYLADNYPLQDYRFIPLVTETLSLWCGLDILFLRASSPGHVFH